MTGNLVKELALEAGFPEWWINHSGSKVIMSWDSADASSVYLEKFAQMVALRCCMLAAADQETTLEFKLAQQKLFGFEQL